MTTDEERDLAVLARREASASRRRQYTIDYPRCACPNEECDEPAREGSLYCWDCSGVEDHDEDCALRCEYNHRLGAKCRTLHHCNVCNPPQPLDGIGMGVVARSLGIGG